LPNLKGKIKGLPFALKIPRRPPKPKIGINARFANLEGKKENLEPIPPIIEGRPVEMGMEKPSFL